MPQGNYLNVVLFTDTRTDTAVGEGGTIHKRRNESVQSEFSLVQPPGTSMVPNSECPAIADLRRWRPSRFLLDMTMKWTLARPKWWTVIMISALSVCAYGQQPLLQITSKPTGARITIGGIDRGYTPCALQPTDTGRLTIELRAVGYPVLKDTLKKQPDSMHSVEEVLPRFASIRIVSHPTNARVVIDGHGSCTTPAAAANGRGTRGRGKRLPSGPPAAQRDGGHDRMIVDL